MSDFARDCFEVWIVKPRLLSWETKFTGPERPGPTIQKQKSGTQSSNIKIGGSETEKYWILREIKNFWEFRAKLLCFEGKIRCLGAPSSRTTGQEHYRFRRKIVTTLPFESRKAKGVW